MQQNGSFLGEQAEGKFFSRNLFLEHFRPEEGVKKSTDCVIQDNLQSSANTEYISW